MKGFLFLLMIIPVSLFAQESADTLKLWETGGLASFNVTQVSLSNWAAGGKSSASGTLLLSTHANYVKDKISWENPLFSTIASLSPPKQRIPPGSRGTLRNAS